MSICYNDEELKAGVAKALSCSRRKRFIVEKYMTCDDTFVYYTFKDGEYYLSAMADRFTTKEQGNLSPVCIAGIYPSKYLDLYFETMHGNICRMFKDIGVQNGVLLVQAFVENGRLHVYDPGFRLQGEAPHLLINAINGFDQTKMLITFALTGSMGNEDLSVIDDYNFRGKYAATIWFLLKEGNISKIEGLSEIKSIPQVVTVVERFYEGDIVEKSFIGTEKQVLMRVYVVCDSKDEFVNLHKKIQSVIKVTNTKGKNMLLSGFDPNKAWNLDLEKIL
jgi:hypothetical protein